MVRDVDIRLPPERAADAGALDDAVRRQLGLAPGAVTHVTLVRRSIDARGRRPVFVLRVRVWIDEAPAAPASWALRLGDVRAAAPVVVVGAGPAGLFAALRLIEGGLRPVVLERGKDVRRRRVDVARLNREGIVKYLERTLSRERADVEHKVGGAGLGLFTVFKSITQLIFNVHSGQRTEVIALFYVRRP